MSLEAMMSAGRERREGANEEDVSLVLTQETLKHCPSDILGFPGGPGDSLAVGRRNPDTALVLSKNFSPC